MKHYFDLEKKIFLFNLKLSLKNSSAIIWPEFDTVYSF